MSPRAWLPLLLLAVLTTGCGSAPPTYRTLDDFSSLDLADHSLITTGSLPPAPEGFSDADVETLGEMLTEVAERGTYDREVWHPESQQAATDHVLKPLKPAVRRALRRLAQDQLSGRPWASVVGTVFADDVEVIGKPRMQRATWDVDRDEVDGMAWLDVRLQTRTFFALRHHSRNSVVAMTHTWELTSPAPIDTYYPAPGVGADVAGADSCAFILRSVITPEQDERRYLRDMKAELRDTSPTKFTEPTGDDGDATAKACRAARS